MLPSLERSCTRPTGNPIRRRRKVPPRVPRPQSSAAWLAVEKPAGVAMGLGLVDCHCHLSASDFDNVCEGDLGLAGVGRAVSPFPQVFLPQILRPYLVYGDPFEPASWN